MTVRGLIRNDKERIDVTFPRPTGDIFILVTECMAIGTGASLTRTRKVRNIEVESDAFQVVKVINESMHCP